MDLHDRVALVTGSSSGLGTALAHRLAARGAVPIVHGRDGGRTAAVAGDLGAVSVVGDLAERAPRERVVAEALAAHGRIDLLVANAGIGWAGALAAMPEETVDALVATNLTGTMQLARSVLPGMLERGTGGLCFVTSIAGRVGVAGESVYAATKSGVDAFAESLRLEIRGTGIGVTVAVPGVVETPFFERRGAAYDRSSPRPLPADVVAARIVRAIERDAGEVWTPRWLRSAAVVRAVAPSAYGGLAARFGRPVRPGRATERTP
ncbi:SDR family NAD(P)-dependent oxidoreductase [Allobranchiibius sp. GilTou73]|uniref:SDR family NAD(P)-dependent oxidoreductase n=1 Tax=unclassified Allobranchiibius TaxID=2649857 RepID=UPI001AA1A678|nr:SDR family NAD(P)-dependent oxidoreductase [Allobranchiibius sp. GilTou73]MBO1768489.1 SDR family NAD(P)-dependent oxidoreductase [Allobranchiibius sp. GilTou38]UIJ34787.1 SDR family NAD(P)-dependent oxidoreductase [Allobranchiibius sp. GilTou73]